MSFYDALLRMPVTLFDDMGDLVRHHMRQQGADQPWVAIGEDAIEEQVYAGAGFPEGRGIRWTGRTIRERESCRFYRFLEPQSTCPAPAGYGR